MVFRKVDTATKLIDPKLNIIHIEKIRESLIFILKQYKKDGVKEIGSNKLSLHIKLSAIDKDELKRVFNDAVNIREGYFGLQREIYR